MKNYTITVNGNVYDVTVEEGTGSSAPAKAATPKAAAPKAAPKATAPAGAQGAVKVNAAYCIPTQVHVSGWFMHLCQVRSLRLMQQQAQQ